MVALNVTVTVLLVEANKVALSTSCVKNKILGETLSLLVTTILVFDVELFPAASVAVAVKFSVVEPKL